MTRIAIVGFGFMGRMHYGNWKRIRGVRVVAICDSNLAQLKTRTTGNLPGVDASTDFSGVSVYDSLDAMLSAGGFDAVDVTLPTVLHPGAVVAALTAGFDVLCEKPMALSAAECDRMLAAAEASGRTLLVAHCLRFWPEYAALRRIALSRRYGEVVSADFRRSSPAPDRDGPHGWFLDERKSGGCLLDLHIHDVDMVLSLFGEPADVAATAHRRADGVVDHVALTYGYPGRVVTSSVSWAVAKTLGFEAAFRVEFEDATLVLDPKRERPFMLYPNHGRPYAPKVSRMSAYEAEQRYFVSLLAGRADRSLLTAEDGRRVVALLEGVRRRLAVARPAVS